MSVFIPSSPSEMGQTEQSFAQKSSHIQQLFTSVLFSTRIIINPNSF